MYVEIITSGCTEGIAAVKKYRPKVVKLYYNEETNKIDFEKIKDNPLLIRNLLITGVFQFVLSYYNYRIAIEEDALEDKGEGIMRLVKTDIYGTEWFQAALTILLRSLLPGSKIVVNKQIQPNSTTFTINGEDLQRHCELMRDLLQMGENEPYSITTFSVNPAPDIYNDRQSWGPSVWFLRMYILYQVPTWQKHGVLNYMQKFMFHSPLILPCSICSYHMLNPTKRALNFTICETMSQGLPFVVLNMYNEMHLHDYVSLDVFKMDDTLEKYKNIAEKIMDSNRISRVDQIDEQHIFSNMERYNNYLNMYMKEFNLMLKSDF